jgi:cytochrome c oxidase subunit I+III
MEFLDAVRRVQSHVFPMHILGLHGMTRRIYTYVAKTGWGDLNLLATIGTGIIGVSVLLFVVNVASALRRSVFAEANERLC